jgi:spore coat protein, CotS family
VAQKYEVTYNVNVIIFLEVTSLEVFEVKDLAESKYNLNIIKLEKVKNVYKINTLDKTYCLKIVKYDYPHFIFILNVIKHVQRKGFENIPEMLPSIEGKDYINFDKFYAYLTPWIDARECNYDNPIDVNIAAKKLADFHIKSKDFEVTEEMKPRVGWLKWIEKFNHRINEMVDFKNIITKKETLTEFDNIYLKNLENEIQRGERAVENIAESNYLCKMKVEISKRELCHHDYAHHNLLMEKDGKIDLIDFDYTILDSHLHDLSSLLIRRMKNGKWGIDNALFILDAYNSIYSIDIDDIPIMAAFMEFPQDFWQVGIQYYYEMQPWGEEFFLKKLNRIIEDSEEKQDFIDEFRTVRYIDL